MKHGVYIVTADTVAAQYLVHGPSVSALQSNLLGDSAQGVGNSFARVDGDRFRLAVEEVNSIDDRL